MEIAKNVKRLISVAIKQIHQNLDPAPILYQFEQKLQELKKQVPDGCQDALEEYTRRVWLLYDGFMTSVENEDQRIQEVVSQWQGN